jgi:multidrug efflux pump subunit AcrB
VTENTSLQQNEGLPEHGVPDSARASWAAKFFLLQPTFGLLLVAMLVIGGLLAYLSLVKESLPDLEIPQATVTTQWAGADPQTMEQEVTEKIEKEIKSLKGVKRIESASFDSYSIIAVEFDANADLQESMQLLRTRVNDAEAELPTFRCPTTKWGSSRSAA